MNAVTLEKRNLDEKAKVSYERIPVDNGTSKEDQKMKDEKRIDAFIGKHKKLLLKLAK